MSFEEALDHGYRGLGWACRCWCGARFASAFEVQQHQLDHRRVGDIDVPDDPEAA